MLLMFVVACDFVDTAKEAVFIGVCLFVLLCNFLRIW